MQIEEVMRSILIEKPRLRIKEIVWEAHLKMEESLAKVTPKKTKKISKFFSSIVWFKTTLCNYIYEIWGLVKEKKISKKAKTVKKKKTSGKTIKKGKKKNSKKSK